MSSISRLYIQTIDDADHKKATKISDRLADGKKASQADEDFYWRYEATAHRIYGEREDLKHKGWNEFRDQAASIEARANGIEKVIYSHWHRAIGYDDPRKMTPDVYAGHWLHAQRNREWFEGEDGKAIFALLCRRYPIPREPLLREGYSYVWITPERPRRIGKRVIAR
jgi:hypothetical protein